MEETPIDLFADWVCNLFKKKGDEEMDEFDKMEEAFKKCKIVALGKNKNGSIKFGGSFQDYNDIAFSKYGPYESGDAKGLPKVVFVKKEPNTWVLTNLIKKG